MMPADASVTPVRSHPVANSVTRTAAILTTFLGTLVMAAWLWDLPRLKSVLPGSVAMKANTALGFIVCGLALWLLRAGRKENGRAAHRGALLLASLATFVGVATTAEYLLKLDLGIDQILFPEPMGAAQTTHPGRMSWPAAMSFTLVGSSLLLLSLRRAQRVAQSLGLLVIFPSGLALVSYFYEVGTLRLVGISTPMALHTAIGFCLLSIGILAANPRFGLMAPLTNDGAAGVLARRLLPAAIAVPLILGWIRLRGQQAGLFGTELGTASIAIVHIVIFAGLIWWIAGLTAAGETAEHEAARRLADVQLRESEARYRDLFENSTDIIQSVGSDGHFQYVNPAWHKALGYDEADLARLTIFDLLSDDGREQCAATFAEVMTGHAHDWVAAEFVTKAGTRIAVEGSVSCRKENGTTVAARCIFRDVTERKRTESELRQAASLRRIAGTTARIGGWRNAHPFDRFTLSDEICDLLDVPRGTSLTGPETIQFYREESRTPCRDAYRACRAEGKPFDLELDLVTARGRSVSARCIGEAERNDAGEIIAVQGSFQDITDGRNAQEALRASEQRYREIIDFAPIGFYQTTIAGKITMINPALAGMLGASSPDQLRGCRTAQDFYVMPEDREQFAARVLLEGVHADEILLRSIDGVPFWVRDDARAIRDASGAVTALEGFITNIDARKRAEEALRDSEERYRRLVESAEEVIFSLSPDATFTSVNPAFERLSGGPAHEWIGRSFWGLVDEPDRDQLVRPWSAVLAGGVVPPVYLRIRAHDGIRTVHTSATAVVREGKVVQITGIARDVTDEWRARQERDELTRRLRVILESIGEGLYELDAEGRCAMINRAGAELLGYTPDELLGRPMHPLTHHSRSASVCPATIAMTTGQSVRSSDEVLWRKDGTAFPAEMVSSPIFDGNSVTGAVVTYTDITRRIAVARAFEQARRVQSLSNLATGMAHQFNNVLMGIQSFAQIIARSAPGETAASAAARIGNSIGVGKRITQDILRFTQPSPPALERVPAAAWIRDLSAEARTLLPDHVELVVGDVPANLALMTDAPLLHQAFMNMILNSGDAMPEGGRVTISAAAGDDRNSNPAAPIEEPEKYVRLTVTDTGCGMSREVANNIFEPFFTTKHSATGIGLAVTWQIILSHGGQVFVESEPGNGTRIHVFIPCAPHGASVAQVTDAASREVAPPMRVLLVEDDSAVAEGISTLLELAGMQVEAVDCGARAVPEVRRFQPGAVVLDIGLPDMDGEAVYEQIAGEWPGLPVIFSTGHADRGRLQHLLDRSNVACLLKPYAIETLLELLDRLSKPSASSSN